MILVIFKAREARSRKNPDNFDEFTISTFSISGKSNNFDDVTISTFLHPQTRYNFNVFAISTFQFPGEIEEVCIISCITIQFSALHSDIVPFVTWSGKSQNEFNFNGDF